MGTYNGNQKSQTIKASQKADMIFARGGNDTVYGYGGDDRIWGGYGSGFPRPLRAWWIVICRPNARIYTGEPWLPTGANPRPA
jgi:Ca2+-binding RTX toxin-like protein